MTLGGDEYPKLSTYYQYGYFPQFKGHNCFIKLNKNMNDKKDISTGELYSCN